MPARGDENAPHFDPEKPRTLHQFFEDLEFCFDIAGIKDSKKKVQASIQGDFVRVAGKDRDTLQEVMQLLRSSDFGIDMQFSNYRTN